MGRKKTEILKITDKKPKGRRRERFVVGYGERRIRKEKKDADGCCDGSGCCFVVSVGSYV